MSMFYVVDVNWCTGNIPDCLLWINNRKILPFYLPDCPILTLWVVDINIKFASIKPSTKFKNLQICKYMYICITCFGVKWDPWDAQGISLKVPRGILQVPRAPLEFCTLVTWWTRIYICSRVKINNNETTMKQNSKRDKFVKYLDFDIKC